MAGPNCPNGSAFFRCDFLRLGKFAFQERDTPRMHFASILSEPDLVASRREFAKFHTWNRHLGITCTHDGYKRIAGIMNNQSWANDLAQVGIMIEKKHAEIIARSRTLLTPNSRIE